MHPEVDAAVFETARGGVLREGLAFDRCDVAVVTNIGAGDHLGLNYITTVEDLAVVKRVIVQNVAPAAWRAQRRRPQRGGDGRQLPRRRDLLCRDRNHPVMATHRAQGHALSIWKTADRRRPGRNAPPHRPDRNPAHPGRTHWFQVENAMAAVAAAWALGPGMAGGNAGLASFINDAATAPGRFNTFNYQGAMVIADYGHNPDAMLALVQTIDNLPSERRSVVISGAGDRRDQDIRDQTRILGAAFDSVILYQDACQRGRADGEVLALLRQGLQDAPRTRHSEEIQGEFNAIDRALAQLNPGDLCLILVDQVEEALAHIAKRVAEVS